MKGVVSVW